MRSAILTWHSLDDSGSVISTPPAVFQRQIESLAHSGIPVVPLEEVRHSSGAVALTFDDGCRNLSGLAFRLLEKFRLPATVFVVSGYCGKTNRWPGQPDSIPELPLLSWEQLTRRPPLVAVGAHTATHPHLTELPHEEYARELRECKDEIEQRLASPVRSLAYPYGSSSAGIRQAAAPYFELAAGTKLGFVSAASDPMDLPRIDMYYFRTGLAADSLFSKSCALYIGLRSAVRDVRDGLRI